VLILHPLGRTPLEIAHTSASLQPYPMTCSLEGSLFFFSMTCRQMEASTQYPLSSSRLRSWPCAFAPPPLRKEINKPLACTTFWPYIYVGCWMDSHFVLLRSRYFRHISSYLPKRSVPLICLPHPPSIACSMYKVET
jgi:hypothetical protein